jgi:hypothetical protein
MKDDDVRVVRERNAFTKGYLPTFSQPTFEIKKVIRGKPNTYQIGDNKGRTIRGNWYKEQLVKAKPEGELKVKKVRMTRMRDGEKEYLVEWVDEPVEAASWITEKDLILTGQS